jgi:hypothetical protein
MSMIDALAGVVIVADVVITDTPDRPWRLDVEPIA